MKKTRIVNINVVFIIIVVFIFALIIFKLLFVGLHGVKVNGESLSKFANNRNTRTEIITARRGTIYSRSDEILAKDVNSYTVIAYLSSSRTTDPKNPHHVVDKEKTAAALSPLINMTEEKILELLNITIKDCDKSGSCTETVPYQVELGPGGRGITELVKDEIDDLGLPGIDFISSTKRYYPNGDFLSYTIGYARTNDEGIMTGEMGLEMSMNDELSGKNGKKVYQSDVSGYQITSSPTLLTEAVSGNDIYLTIDTNIQMFAEEAITELEEGSPEWISLSVMDAKTGEILAIASSPSFNNNTLEIESYYDPFVSNTYEPGSVMKIFSFMAAMENGIYNGEETFKSGTLKVDDATIKDWNNYGWGTITYDEGFMGSSNVAATKLGLELGRAKLKDYYTSLGFGTEVDLGLPNQMQGIINFKYNSEIATASFGQGITVTASQMLQAMSSLSNDGIMLKPYLISKIVSSETGETILENKRTELGRVASSETVDKMIDIMRGVVDGRARMSTGTSYYIKGYDIVGKTGTAEIAGNNGYLKNTYIRSFGGMFPGEDPQIIIYLAASKLTSSNYMYSSIKTLVKNISTYLNIYGSDSEEDTVTYKLDSYINSSASETNDLLKNAGLNPIVIGNGNKIVKQYPSKGTILNIDNNVLLFTNGNYEMVDIKGLSKKETEVFCNYTNIICNYEGNGYVSDYEINKNELDSETILNIKLEKKF